MLQQLYFYFLMGMKLLHPVAGIPVLNSKFFPKGETTVLRVFIIYIIIIMYTFYTGV
jgi:hypothetical protein